jgi:two-component system chemotaxis response regulator CheB
MNADLRATREAAVDVVALVASTGGLAALSTVLRDLPPDLPATVLVQQHLGAGSTVLAQVLSHRTGHEVITVTDGARLIPGQIMLCPPLHRLEVRPDGTCGVQVSGGAREHPHDALMRSMADVYGPRSLAVVLTGLLDDGAAGTVAMKAAGGLVLAQSEATSEQPSMPRAAAAAGASILALDEIGGVIVDMVRGARSGLR